MLRRRTSAESLVRLVAAAQCLRRSQSSLGASEFAERNRGFNALFAEARELVADAAESVGTTDFAEDAEEAVAGVKAAVDAFTTLIADMEASGQHEQSVALQREYGQKVKQLEVELNIVITDANRD